MTTPSTFSFFKRFSVIVVVVTAVVVTTFVVGRLRTFFGSDLPAPAGTGSTDSIVAFNPKA